jgi:hypothetical protein
MVDIDLVGGSAERCFVPTLKQRPGDHHAPLNHLISSQRLNAQTDRRFKETKEERFRKHDRKKRVQRRNAHANMHKG